MVVKVAMGTITLAGFISLCKRRRLEQWSSTSISHCQNNPISKLFQSSYWTVSLLLIKKKKLIEIILRMKNSKETKSSWTYL